MQTGREVKFQAWIIPTGEMKVVTNLCFDEKGNLYGIKTPDTPINDCVSIASVKLRQFTGLRDRDGREIYEGDIWLPQGCETPRVIVWNRYGWWFQYPNGGVTRPMEWTEDGEVIGDIYRNPELL